MSDKKQLEYVYLSNNCGLKVSNMCFGTGTFGQTGHQIPLPGNTNEEESHTILDKFAEMGGNFIDCANVYGKGEAERYVGSWMKKNGNRDRMVVTSKARILFDATDPNGVGLSRKHIMKSVEDSLERLQTNYIDLFQIHTWDSATPIAETLDALNDLVKCGKIRYVGGSNLCGWQLQKIIEINRQMGYKQFISQQQQYNLLERASELEVFDVCKNEGVGLMAWSPLKGGLLTGKVAKETKLAPIGSRLSTGIGHPRMEVIFNFSKTLADEQYWKIMQLLATFAQIHDKTIPQIAIRWVLQRKPVSVVIIGAKSVSQLEDNARASSGWKLTDEQMQLLNDASAIPEPFPYGYLKAMNLDRMHPGVITGLL